MCIILKVFSIEQIIKSILPATFTESPCAFETIGHIAHLNLRECFLPWKNIIGQVIIDKFRNITNVVNKLGDIQSKFRVFDMEVLAGDGNMSCVLVFFKILLAI